MTLYSLRSPPSARMSLVIMLALVFCVQSLFGRRARDLHQEQDARIPPWLTQIAVIMHRADPIPYPYHEKRHSLEWTAVDRWELWVDPCAQVGCKGNIFYQWEAWLNSCFTEQLGKHWGQYSEKREDFPTVKHWYNLFYCFPDMGGIILVFDALDDLREDRTMSKWPKRKNIPPGFYHVGGNTPITNPVSR